MMNTYRKLRNFSPLALVLVVGVTGCGGSGGTPSPAPMMEAIPAGTIYGTVVMGSPVRGMVVTAYRIDSATGIRQEKIASSEPTGVDGRYAIELGGSTGPVLLEATGQGATYMELVSGNVVTVGSEAVLRAAYRNPDATGPGAFNYAGNAIPQPGIVIGPWSELAYAHAEAARRLGRSSDFPMALERAHSLFKEHLEYSFDSVVPSGMEGGHTMPSAPAMTEGTHATLMLLGLSSYADRTKGQANTTAAFVTKLRLDLEEDSLFDGRIGDRIDIEFGRCADLCRLSGKTLRSDFANSIVYYLNSSQNRTGISAGSLKDLLTRVSLRQSELFSSMDAPIAYDGSAPEIKVLSTQVVGEEERTTWGVAKASEEPPDWDARLPIVTSGIPQKVVTFSETSLENRPRLILNATTTLSPGSRINSLTPSATVPQWRFEIATEAQDTVSARLLRKDQGKDQVIRDWFALDKNAPEAGVYVQKPAYSVVLAQRLAPELAMLDGDYELQVKVEDVLLNTTLRKVYWTQTITSPPVRLVPGGCDPCNDTKCPTYYSMGGHWTQGSRVCPNRPRTNDIEGLLKGTGSADGTFMVAHVRVDNPNPFPIRVKYEYDRMSLSTSITLLDLVCGQYPYPIELCLAATATAGNLTSITLRNDRVPISVTPGVNLWPAASTSIGWSNPQPAVACPDCEPNEFIIPIGFYASLFFHSSTWTSILPEDFKSKAALHKVVVKSNGEFPVQYYGYVRLHHPGAPTVVDVLGSAKAQAHGRIMFSVRPNHAGATFKPAVGPDFTLAQFLEYNRPRYDELDIHWNWLDVIGQQYVEQGTCYRALGLCGWPEPPPAQQWQWRPWIEPWRN